MGGGLVLRDRGEGADSGGGLRVLGIEWLEWFLYRLVVYTCMLR